MKAAEVMPVCEQDVPYMERTLNFYRAQGYDRDYRWAQHSDAPFVLPSKALRKCRVAVVTTAMPDTKVGRAQRRVYSLPSKPIPTSLYTDDLSWHKKMTHTQDVASFLPLQQLNRCKELDLIGEVAARFHCIPTEYSQSNTIENDAPEILARCQQDAVDVAILVPL